MRNLKGVLFCVILMLNLIQLSAQGIQSKDSTRLYCQPIWIAWRVQRDLTRLDIVDAALDSAVKTIILKNEALLNASLTIHAQDSAYQAKDLECKTIREVTKLELKQAKKQGRKQGLLSGVVISVVIFILAK